MKWFWRLVPAAILAVLVGLFMVRLDRGDATDFTSHMIGKPAPDFALEGYNADHPGLATADLARGDVSVVNIFGSWCAPCIAELPSLKALADEHGVTIHAVAYRDTPETLDKVFARHPNPFTRIGLDPKGIAALGFGITGAPESFIINGRGEIVYRHVGDLKLDEVEAFALKVEAAR